MRQLHLVGVTDDKTGLIVADGRGAKATTYVVPINDELRTAVQPAVTRRRRARDDEGFDSGSSLSPREIQARLRSGRSVAQVAAEAGVGADWIDRFAGPIVAEQRAVLERALDLHMDSSRRGQSTRPLGESVERNLLIKGVRLTDDEVRAGWAAYLYRSGEWVVSFRYVFRRKEVTVDWLFDLAEDTMVALDRAALALGFVEPAGSAEAASPPSDAGLAASPSPPTSPSPSTAPSSSAATAPPRRTRTRVGAPASAATSAPASPATAAPATARPAAATPASARPAAAAASKSAKRSSARAGQEQLVRDRRPPGASAPSVAASSAAASSAASAGARRVAKKAAAPPPASAEDKGAQPRRRRNRAGEQGQLPGV